MEKREREDKVNKILEYLPALLQDNATIQSISDETKIPSHFVAEVVQDYHSKMMSLDPQGLEKLLNSFKDKVTKEFALSAMNSIASFGPLYKNLFKDTENLQKILSSKVQSLIAKADTEEGLESISFTEIRQGVKLVGEVKTVLGDLLSGPFAMSPEALISINNNITTSPPPSYSTPLSITVTDADYSGSSVKGREYPTISEDLEDELIDIFKE